MKPLTITKDEYSGKYIAWHLPSDKIVDIHSEIVSKIFWKCTNAFYLIGVGTTEEEATKNLKNEVLNFIVWVGRNRENLCDFDICSNLPEYREAIYAFKTK